MRGYRPGKAGFWKVRGVEPEKGGSWGNGEEAGAVIRSCRERGAGRSNSRPWEGHIPGSQRGGGLGCG